MGDEPPSPDPGAEHLPWHRQPGITSLRLSNGGNLVARERRVLATKLSPPSLPPNTIVSERLHQQLTRGARNRITLVSGQPGAGKTFLVASWVADGRAPAPVAWVSLDGGGDD